MTTLLKDFYTLDSTDYKDNCGSFNAQVSLNTAHPVYKGHFPGTPIAPGVCLTQVIQEILSQSLKKELVLVSADNIKFLSLINPTKVFRFKIEFKLSSESHLYSVQANYINGQTTYMKFKGKFRTENGL